MSAACRGAFANLREHSNVWHAATEQDAPEDTPLLRLPIHQSEALWGGAQEAGQSAFPHSSCHYTANKVLVCTLAYRNGSGIEARAFHMHIAGHQAI